MYKFLVFFIILFIPHLSCSSEFIKIGITGRSYRDFKKLNGQENCRDTINYNSDSASRGAIEMMLLCRIFSLNKIKIYSQFQVLPNYAQQIKFLRRGTIDIQHETVWDSEATSDLLTSLPVINDGEFTKGIYALKSNKIQKISSLRELQQYTAIVVSSWNIDIKTLESIVPKKNVHKASTFEAALRILQKGRADYILLEFQKTDDYHFKDQSITLLPVKGIKVKLNGSRSFAVSKNSPKADKLINIINNGIKEMRKSNEIKKAFEGSGFIGQHKDWKLLN